MHIICPSMPIPTSAYFLSQKLPHTPLGAPLLAPGGICPHLPLSYNPLLTVYVSHVQVQILLISAELI